MEMLYLLVPIALITLAVVIKVLFWAINSGQYDDLDTEAQRILFEEDYLEESDFKQSSTQVAAAKDIPEKSETNSLAASKES